jgi:hypothetical protein
MAVPHNFRDLTGRHLLGMTVLHQVGVDAYGHSRWLCQKPDGSQAVRFGSHLTGASSSPERGVWWAMIHRCRPNGHPDYGARGIRVCPRWLESFDNFMADMGPRPSKEHSLDRIGANSDYTPENCRWATRVEQARNHRDTKRLTYQGKTLTIPDWAERLGMKTHNIHNRLKMGLPLDEVLDPQRRRTKSPDPLSGRIRECHGLSGTPAYAAWLAMKARCESPKHPAWANYGGRGIVVDPRWSGSFEAFLADVGPRPSPGHSLDREDNDKGYVPGNVRWSTRKEQARNTRGCRVIEYGGRKLVLAQWADDLGIPAERIRNRLRIGWPVGQALGLDARSKPFLASG